jgi:outer membrane protein assembly factor BamB
MNTRTVLTLTFWAICAATGLPAVVAGAEDWPQWRGMNRDGKSPETGLLKPWPPEGPKLLLTIGGIGQGWSSPAVVGGRIYITGLFREKARRDLHAFCFEKDGTKVWEVSVGPEWEKSNPGSKSMPAVDGDLLYVITGRGRVAALEKDTGRELWAVELTERFKAPVPQHGFTGAVLVDGDKVVCVAGASDACIVALNKKTGETVWTSKGLSDPAHYSSPIVFDFEGVRQYAVLTSKGVVSVKAEDGTLLWRYDRPACKTNANVPTPVYADGYVFCASGYGNGGGAAKLEMKDGKLTATQAWETKNMDCHHGGYVVVDGCIYGNHARGWACLDLKTGQKKFIVQPAKGTGVGKGSVTYADGMLYTLGEDGTMGLVEAKPDEYRLVSTFRIPNAGADTWAHPVISSGRLFLRRADKLFVYSISRAG